MKKWLARLLLTELALLSLLLLQFCRPSPWPESANVAAGLPGLLYHAEALTPVTLRVGTYNAKHFELGSHDFSQYSDMICNAELDVLGIQEVDNGTNRSNGLKEAKLLAEELGWYYYFTPAIPLEGGQYGLAILSRYPIGALTVHKYTVTDAEQRILAEATITVDSVPIRVLNTHLSPDLYDPAQGIALRAGQFIQLAAVTGVLENYILLGDFNTDTPAELAQAPRIRWANVINSSLITCPAGNAAIDNIGTGQNGRFSNVTVVPSSLSDHNLLYADIAILTAK